MSKTEVDFVQGADGLAPGISRVQDPLFQTVNGMGPYQLRSIRFPTMNTAFFHAFLYGLLPARLALSSAPLVHVANAWYAHVVPLLTVPALVTCHHPIDEEDLRQGGSRPAPHRLFHFRACLRGMSVARLIVCDSDYVAAHLEAKIPESRGRLRTVYPGISPAFRFEEGRGLTEQNPFVLYVGSEQARKNLSRLVESIAAAKRTIPSLRFVKVGTHQTTAGRENFLQSLRAHHLSDHTTVCEHVSDAELASLYRAAAVTVLPSLQEGFGFPPLEAMACGCPVIVSNRGSLVEVTRGAAIVIDPLDVRGLTHAIQRVVSDEVLRRDLINRGLREARHYSWERAARAYISLYDEVLTTR